MSASSLQSLRLIECIEKNEALEAWKVLWEAKNCDSIDLLSPNGTLQVTALQFAAWRGWIDLLAALKERGANVNVSDKLGRSPLHYAAHQGNAEAVEWLIRHGATLDNSLAINSCTRTDYRGKIREHHNVNLVIGKNLPLPDCWGRTPLHQAVRNNHPEVVKILVSAGANVDARDERGVTPILLAGTNVKSNDPEEMRKFVRVIDILVSGNVATNIIHPDTGSSALHHAATLGSATATRRLLEGGAWPLFQCPSTGSTALHIAAAAGSLDTLTVLLEVVNSDHIEIQDKVRNPIRRSANYGYYSCGGILLGVGRTPLHRAAYQGHRRCVKLLVNYNGNLAAKTKTGVSVIDAIFTHVPRPLNFVKDLLDARVRSTGNCCTEKATSINIDFGVLAPKGQLQMAVITALIDAASGMEQLGILQHPLVETFLSLKWSRLRGFFFLLILVHLLFVLSLSGFAIVLVRWNEDFTLTRYVLMLCSCILLVHNMIQVLMVPRYYLRQFETWASLTCAIVSLVTSTIAGNEIGVTENKAAADHHEQQECSQWIFYSISIAILFAWIQMMLLVGRFPTYGYYALMFSTVLKNILKVLLAYVFLIIGFALSFSVLFHENDQFRDPWRALVKTVVMMMGEYEYGDLFNEDDRSYQLNWSVNSTASKNVENLLHATSRIVFLAFVVLASIVLMNLMIGLAVSDIQGLEKEGHTRSLLKQAEFVAHLERVTSHRIFRSKWLHPRLRTLVHSRRTIVTKMTIGCIENYSYQSRDISPELLEALFSLACDNSDTRDETGCGISNENVSATLSSLEQLIRQLQSRENDTCRVNSCSMRSFVKGKQSRRITSTNI